jgi:hypothetical protein
VIKILLSMTSRAIKMVSVGAIVSEIVGKSVLTSPDRVKMIEEPGGYLWDLWEVAGMTRKDVSRSIQLADGSLLAAVENGSATLSFELILRLAALLARHGPIPFITNVKKGSMFHVKH